MFMKCPPGLEKVSWFPNVLKDTNGELSLSEGREEKGSLQTRTVLGLAFLYRLKRKCREGAFQIKKSLFNL